jgi:hypothetical protein
MLPEEVGFQRCCEFSLEASAGHPHDLRRVLFKPQVCLRLRFRAKVYECLGHDIVTGDATEKKWPECFAGEPLRGKTLVEVFSGNPDEGGGKLVEAWEAAGGVGILYDTRVDPDHNFLTDDSFWKEQIAEPKDAYHFAFPCHHMSIANTTGGKPRSMDNPYGNESDQETRYYRNAQK